MGPRSVEIIRRPVALLIVASLVVAASDSGDGADRAVGATDPADAPPAATSVTSATTTTVTVAAASTIGASPSTTAPAIAFPTEAFARISDKPVTAELVAQFQADLGIMAGDGGMTATVMTADGTWSGAAGTADGSRPVQVDDQFAIGSVTKSVVAAQVMQLVEAGELSLDDRAADRLPADFDFDTNGATIRQLLNHQSGLRNPDTVLFELVRTDRQHVWTTAEVLDLAGDPLWPVGSRFEYSNANYFLLGAIIEQARGRPLAQVLRDGVLAGDGLERLVYQPDERPSEPMDMPAGESPAAFEVGGGYLPSIASATGGGPAAAMASLATSFRKTR